jgi:Tol biopolymer transport system component
MYHLVAALPVAACSFTIAAAPSDPSIDGPASDQGIDQALDSVVPLGPWGAPVKITDLSSNSHEADASLTADLLEIYFRSTRPGGLGDADIWYSARATTTSPWSTPTVVVELSTSVFEGTPHVSPDGLTIYINSSRSGTLGSYDLFRAKRAARTSPWSTPVHIPELSTASQEYGATADANDTWIVFNTNRSTGGNAHDLWESVRSAPAAVWGPPSPIPMVNDAAAHDAIASPSSDGLALYFHSNRPGGVGSFDLFVAVRPDRGSAFGTPTPILELGSVAVENSPWISTDQRYMVFTSDRDGTLDLFEARR